MELEIVLPPIADETDPLEFGLVSLTRAIAAIDAELVHHGGLGGEFGYGADWENDVFLMKPYCWCERTGECPWCTSCGEYEDTCVACRLRVHTEDCFQNELAKRKRAYDALSGYDDIEAAQNHPSAFDPPKQITPQPGIVITIGVMRTALDAQLHEHWKAAHTLRNEEHAKLTEALYRERGLIPSPYAYHCDCGAEDHWKQAIDRGDGCDFECGRGIFERFAPWMSDGKRSYYDPPNFWHKPSNFRVRWYKWIGRNMGTNRDANRDELQTIFTDCISSLRENR